MGIEYSVRGLLTAFFRQKWKFFLVCSAITLVGLFYLLGMPKIYEAYGSMLVRFGQDARPNLSVGNSGASEVSSSDRAEIIQSNISIIYSNDLLRNVVSSFGPETIYPGISEAVVGQDSPVGAAVNRLQRGDLKVNSGGRNNIIEIRVRNADPKVAADLATLLMEKFTVRQAEIYNKPQTGFLQQQIVESSQKLSEAQKEFQAFKRTAGVSDIGQEVDQLIRQKGELSAIAYQAVTQAQADLAALQAKQAEMLATYRESSPVMQRMRQSIAAVRAQVRERQADLNSANGLGTDSALTEKIGEIDARLAFLESQRSAYEELANSVKTAQENYKYYQQRGEEARANDILNQQNITRISVVDTPQPPTRPTSRHRLLLLIGFLVTGGLLGLACALIFELLDDRFRTPTQLASRLGLPVLATFSAKGRA